MGKLDPTSNKLETILEKLVNHRVVLLIHVFILKSVWHQIQKINYRKQHIGLQLNNLPPNIICSAEKSPWSGISP